MATQGPKAKPKLKPDKQSLVEGQTDQAVEIKADEADEAVEIERSVPGLAKRTTRNVGSIVIVPPRGRKARTIYL